MIEDGILLIGKPAQMTSFGVVARVRRVLSQHYGRKMKVGHTGTLDPFATGLMIIVVGKECKIAQKYSKLDKTYEATIVLGRKSSTGDPEGDISEVSNTTPSREDVEEVLKSFIGEIQQKPPIYSAIKIDGKRAYDLARAGKEVDIPTRLVTIHTLELLDYSYPNLSIRTHVSSGTYIRTLAEDIGEKLSVGAYCSQLRRVTVGEWNLGDATELSVFMKDKD